MNSAGFLLDTNVLSELDRPRPNPRVTRFFAETDAALLYISDVVLAELRFGIEKVTDRIRRNRMQNWLEQVGRPLFHGRVLSADEHVWLLWKALEQEGRRTGYTYPQPDLVIAAIALRHGLTIVTRDAEPFTRAGAPVHNPWEDSLE
jgi:predicted nucleic acid-binding protein